MFVLACSICRTMAWVPCACARACLVECRERVRAAILGGGDVGQARNATRMRPRRSWGRTASTTWCGVWRNTPNAATTHTVSYARSADLTVNNNVQVGFDAAGDPVVAYHKYNEEGNTQVYVARPNGSGWENVQVSDRTGAWDFSQTGSLEFQVKIYWQPDGNLRLDVTCLDEARTFILDGETLEPLAEIAAPASVPPEVSELLSDYEHQPEPGELGTEMQVNLTEDLGGSSADSRSLPRWESLGQNRDLPRVRWPEPQPLEVVVIGTVDACGNGGWRWKAFRRRGFDEKPLYVLSRLSREDIRRLVTSSQLRLNWLKVA